MNDCEAKPSKKERLSALEDHVDDINERLSDMSASVDKRASALEAHVKDQTTRLYRQDADLSQEFSRLINRFNEHRTEIAALLDDKIVSLVSENNALREKLGNVEAALSQRIGIAMRKGDDAVKADKVIDDRHFAAMEIVGERIGELVERLDKLESAFAGFGQDTSGVTIPTPFPTGAATTVDEVLAAVPPVEEQDDGPPRRGDRVRLEGARLASDMALGALLPDAWYDVVGHAFDTFQVRGPAERSLYWVYDADPGLKEVRRGAAQLD